MGHCSISIIIPVLNEGERLGRLLGHLRANSSPKNIREILVVDGGSTDGSVAVAREHGAHVLLSAKGRAIQMNLGAKNAKGTVLYFLHADTYPPANFDHHIHQAVTKGYLTGCFRLRFDSNDRLLRFFAWFTRINRKICRGGDQSLFISMELYRLTNGFNENYIIYEDNEFIGRLYDTTNFIVLPQYVVTSARRYSKKGSLLLQYHFGMVHLKNRLGAGPDDLYQYYRKYIGI
ncbi:MAG: TIGR04283 family arsenosugar biosynthesis glycosyltransferase [Sediminicola sp.]|tara:strand:+ start:49436 stop:50134 length:699 start_codon:yes stop_codon:yes gene_type:complete